MKRDRTGWARNTRIEASRRSSEGRGKLISIFKLRCRGWLVKRKTLEGKAFNFQARRRSNAFKEISGERYGQR